jgi:hypothetical protein
MMGSPKDRSAVGRLAGVRLDAAPLLQVLGLIRSIGTLGSRGRPCLFRIVAAGVLALAIRPEATAAFISPYSVTAFTLVNNNSDGTAVTPDFGQSLVLTGGNNGSGLFGTTDFSILAPASASIQFNYMYSSLDFPGYDRAGYFIEQALFLLADTDGQTGTAMFSIVAGQQFGFHLETDDNTGEPGVLTVSAFDAVPAGASTPEPGNLGSLCVALVAAAGTVRWRRQRRNQEKTR